MRGRAFVLVTLSILAAVLVTVSLLSRGPVHAQVPNTWQVTVIEDGQLDAPLDNAIRTLYQNAAGIISTVATVPNDRLTYFSAYPNVTRWAGLVTNVQANNNGYVVTINVCMNPSTAEVYASNYVENWFIDANDNATYLGFLDPDGTSGQTFDCLSFSAYIGDSTNPDPTNPDPTNPDPID